MGLRLRGPVQLALDGKEVIVQTFQTVIMTCVRTRMQHMTKLLNSYDKSRCNCFHV